MAKSANQKLRLLYLRDYLKKNTDENHPAKVADIIGYLDTQGINCERKTVYDDVETLRTYGDDIVLTKGKNGGYFCASHEFDEREIKMLVDSVQSSKFISERQSFILIDKLEALTNIYEAKKLSRQVYVNNRIKNIRESVFINVDYISEAINSDRQIAFKYFSYGVDKKQVYRHNGKTYEISPYALVLDDEYYYLVAYDAGQQKIKHFRVDKMDKIRVLDAAREGKQTFKEIDMSRYNVKVFSMFGGREEKVTLRFENSLAGVVIDRFGKDVIIIPEDENHFLITVTAQISPQFFAWLFGFANQCEITEPESVRNEFEKNLKNTLKIYK